MDTTPIHPKVATEDIDPDYLHLDVFLVHRLHCIHNTCSVICSLHLMNFYFCVISNEIKSTWLLLSRSRFKLESCISAFSSAFSRLAKYRIYLCIYEVVLLVASVCLSLLGGRKLKPIGAVNLA